jgi:hypothetical protein
VTTDKLTRKGKAKIIQWNVCSIQTKKQEKLGYLKASKPIIAFINEPRRKFQLKGYNCYFAKAAKGKHKKINCGILVSESIDITERITKTDYVSIIARGAPFETPTLLCCLYSNPSPKTGSHDRA